MTTVYADNIRSVTALLSDAATMIDKGTIMYCGTTGGSANAHTASSNPTFTGLATGMSVRVVAGFTNTSTTSLNINSTGTVTVKRTNGDAVYGGDIVAGSVYDFFYNGTYWLLINPTYSINTYTPTLTTQAGTYTSTTITYARYVSVGPKLVDMEVFFFGTQGAATSAYLNFTLPYTSAAIEQYGPLVVLNNAVYEIGNYYVVGSSTNCRCYRNAQTAWGTTANNYVIAKFSYQIA